MLAHAVDYGPTALWITMLRICGLRSQGSLWITMLRICRLGEEMWGWRYRSPLPLWRGWVLHASHPADALLVLTGEGEETVQGDTAPCGTTDRDAAAPHLLTHALRE